MLRYWAQCTFLFCLLNHVTGIQMFQVFVPVTAVELLQYVKL